MAAAKKQITVNDFIDLKRQGQRITMLTAYDFTTAKILDQAGIDGILVGDSLGMVVQGRETTLKVSLDEIIYHAEMVGRAVEHSLIVVDLPFPTHLVGDHEAIAAAARVLKETECQTVKLEGGVRQAGTIAALVSAGIPVMGHIGLQPQSVLTMGGYKVQRDEEQLLADAKAVEDAGAFSVVLECMEASIAAKITETLSIPTIGIGAGEYCDGQVLVINDLLGLTNSPPRFVKEYAQLRSTIGDAVSRYCQDVQSKTFPDSSNSY
jgi:3-methyl-2-oxobutanoate hydroxymethyltransferase